MQNNGTALRTVTATSGMILPATINPHMDFNLMDTACIVYHRCNGQKVAYDTLEQVKDAMRDSSAVVALYADGKGEIAARVLWPFSHHADQGQRHYRPLLLHAAEGDSLLPS